LIKVNNNIPQSLNVDPLLLGNIRNDEGL